MGITLGVVPIKRGGTDRQVALGQKDLFLQKIRELCPPEVRLCDLEGAVPDGMLSSADQLPAAEAAVREADALFLPHCDFGCEEVAARIAHRLRLPTLLWGNRDPFPDENLGRDRDTQCGTLATSKALQRYGVPFSYILNSDVESERFAKGLLDFCAVASVARAAKGMRVLQVSSRPQPFLSVICNESELMEKFGVEITPWSGHAAVEAVRRVMREGGEEFRQAYREFTERLDCEKMPEEGRKAMAAIRVAVRQKVRRDRIDAVALECWSLLGGALGVSGCQVIGMLSDEGIPAACETDVLGAVTARLLQAASLGREPVFFSDITSRHPEDDNVELLWHCGPYPSSLACPECRPWVAPGGQGNFRVKDGPVTVARLDALGGKYTLFSGQGVSEPGPVKNGTYCWLRVDNWEDWEEKIVFGPYIHHVACAFGNYSQILSEACKYIAGLEADPVRPVKKTLG